MTSCLPPVAAIHHLFGAQLVHEPLDLCPTETCNLTDLRLDNLGSCVHPLCITGIEITFENGPRLRLIKWGQATEGHALTIQRTVLEETWLGGQ